MLPTIKFDRKPQRRTVEIKNVWTRRVLPSKTCSIHLRVSQLAPKLAFHIGGVAA
jgi:hypothetical protein